MDGVDLFMGRRAKWAEYGRDVAFRGNLFSRHARQ